MSGKHCEKLGDSLITFIVDEIPEEVGLVGIPEINEEQEKMLQFALDVLINSQTYLEMGVSSYLYKAVEELGIDTAWIIDDSASKTLDVKPMKVFEVRK